MKSKTSQNFRLISIILLFALFLSISAVSAHQPRLELGVNSSLNNPIAVQNPEISQAFYGNLNGQPDYYQIKSDKPFEFYANILVPESPGIAPDFVSAEITDSSGNTIAVLNGTNSTWKSFYEEFGGDYYLMGPSFDQNVSAGTYTIKVFNSNNTGKYSLAIGSTETYPPNEALKALINLPILKEKIFGKPVTALFFEFLGLILALGTTMVLWFMLLRSRKSEEITKITIKAAGILKPMLWIGILITAILWIYVLLQDTSNIIGLVNTMVLVIAIILSWHVGSKISKMEFGKIPFIKTTVLALVWWLFVYWAITVI